MALAGEKLNLGQSGWELQPSAYASHIRLQSHLSTNAAKLYDW